MLAWLPSPCRSPAIPPHTSAGDAAHPCANPDPNSRSAGDAGVLCGCAPAPPALPTLLAAGLPGAAPADDPNPEPSPPAHSLRSPPAKPSAAPLPAGPSPGPCGGPRLRQWDDVGVASSAAPGPGSSSGAPGAPADAPRSAGTLIPGLEPLGCSAAGDARPSNPAGGAARGNEVGVPSAPVPAACPDPAPIISTEEPDESADSGRGRRSAAASLCAAGRSCDPTVTPGPSSGEPVEPADSGRGRTPGAASAWCVAGRSRARLRGEPSSSASPAHRQWGFSRQVNRFDEHNLIITTI